MRNKYIAITILIALGIATRFLPHVPNFTAVGAIAIFSGRYLNKKLAWALPLLAMFISDIFIGFYSAPMMISVYLSFALMVLLGHLTQARSGAWVGINTVAGSLAFYIITNFAVWAFGTMYTHNFSGLIQSYYLALPFFRSTLISDLIYTTLLVGGYEAIQYLASKRLITKNIPV